MNRRIIVCNRIKALLLVALLFVSTSATSNERRDKGHEKTDVPIKAAASATTISSNGLIAFAAASQIFIMNVDGSGVRQLTNNAPGVHNHYPALSHDGSRVAFIRDKGLGVYALCVTGISGEGLQCPVSNFGAMAEPTWSPDGSKIAFVKGNDPTAGGFANLTGCNSEIYVIDLTNGQEVSLTRGAGGTDPTWSPDGTRIAFSSLRSGNYEIYTMDVNGSQVQRLTYTSWAEAEPAWSPDERRIAYVSHLIQDRNECGFMSTGGVSETTNSATSASVYLMDADGAHQTKVDGTDGTTEVAWSPTGVWLAIALNVKGDSQIYTSDLWGWNLTRLTSDAARKSSPSWASPQTTSR